MKISVNNVNHKFQGFASSSHDVFNNLNLEFESGKITCILGKSGCGKSTLLKLLGGLIRQTSGEIMYDEELMLREEIGFVFQNSNLLPWLNVFQNIGIRYLLKDQKLPSSLINDLINDLGLSGFEKSMPNELSGGMSQRVSIGRAIVHEPNLILMDEPFSALDKETKKILHKLILDLFKKIKSTIVFVTHDLDEAILLGDNLVFMNTDGSIENIITKRNFIKSKKQFL